MTCQCHLAAEGRMYVVQQVCFEHAPFCMPLHTSFIFPLRPSLPSWPWANGVGCLGNSSKLCCLWTCFFALVCRKLSNSAKPFSYGVHENSGIQMIRVTCCVQAAEGGSVHPAQLEEVPGPQCLSAVPLQGCTPAVCLALQAGPPRAAQEASLPKRSWQAAAGLYTSP